jgi:hypothetical protein
MSRGGAYLAVVAGPDLLITDPVLSLLKIPVLQESDMAP